MYLLVFVTLMIGVIGTYTQVLGLQAARFASNQSAVGNAMLQWHAAAISMAVSILKTNAAAYTPAIQSHGCSLTYNLPPNVGGGFNQCPSPTLVGGGSDPTGTVTTGPLSPTLNIIPNVTTAKNECVHLTAKCNTFNANGCAPPPPNHCDTSYDITHFQFYSILYKDSTTNQNFVVTFVPAPTPSTSNPPPGYISLVPITGISQVGLSTSDLMRQLNKAGAPNYTYGGFKGFPSGPQLVTTGGTYNLPGLPTAGFPNLCNPPGYTVCNANGSIGVVGTPDGF